MSDDGENARQQIPEEKPEEKPEETKAMLEVPKATLEAPKSVELTDAALASVSGGTVTTNLANQRHEMVKGVVQNLRG